MQERSNMSERLLRQIITSKVSSMRCVCICFFTSSGRLARSSPTLQTCSAMLGFSPEVKATHFDGLVLNHTQVSDHVTLSCFCLGIFSDTPSCQTSGVIGGPRTVLFTFLDPLTQRRFAEQAFYIFNYARSSEPSD